MNNVDNYNEIRTNHTPTPEITTSEDTGKQSEEPIINETAITTTTTTEENEIATNETRSSHLEEQKLHKGIYKIISYKH